MRNNDYGQLGRSDMTMSDTPLKVPGLENIVQISAGGYHNLALDDDGRVWGWGDSTDSQVDPTDVSVIYSARVIDTGAVSDGVAAVEAGGKSSYVLSELGNVWGWGSNSDGQMAHAASVSTVTEVTQIDISSAATECSAATVLFAGYEHCLATCAGGATVGWGDNTFYQVGGGINSDMQYHEATLVGPRDSFWWASAFSAYGGWKSHSAAISAGSLYTWGRNDEGECTGEETVVYGPTQVDFVIGYIEAVSGGSEFTVVGNSNGKFYSFGTNSIGQLGNSSFSSGGAAYSTSPVVVSTSVLSPTPDTHIASLTSGYDFTCVAFGIPPDADASRLTFGQVYGWFVLAGACVTVLYFIVLAATEACK